MSSVRFSSIQDIFNHFLSRQSFVLEDVKYFLKSCYVILRYVTLRYVTLRYVILRYVRSHYVSLYIMFSCVH